MTSTTMFHVEHYDAWLEVQGSWLKLMMRAWPYYRSFAADTAGRVRARRAVVESSFGALGDQSLPCMVDYVIYRCPVREMFVFALLDNVGRYWVANEWHACGVFRSSSAPLLDEHGAQPQLHAVTADQLVADGEQGRPKFEGAQALTPRMLENWTPMELTFVTRGAVEAVLSRFWATRGSIVFARDNAPFEKDISNFTFFDPYLGAKGYWMARAGVAYSFDQEWGAGAFLRSIRAARARHSVHTRQVTHGKSGEVIDVVPLKLEPLE